MFSALARFKWPLLLVALFGITTLWLLNDRNYNDFTTITLDRGTVREVVAVSGFVEATETADLGFPATGRVTALYVDEGNHVATGDLLASIGTAGVVQDRQAAAAAVTEALAARTALLRGQTVTEVAINTATIAEAEASLQQTITTEEAKIEQAEIALRSTNLAAVSTEDDEELIPPTISGSYTCTEEGQYFIDIYPSRTDSGYSFSFSGLEEGTAPVNTLRPIPFGSCGLSIQFDATQRYVNSEWSISIPNALSSSYNNLATTLAVTKQQAEQAITAAREAVALARARADNDAAAPRTEDVIAADAAVLAAESKLASFDKKLADYAIFAPFDGIISSVDTSVGETVSVTPVISLLNDATFVITARIPEIDIASISTGQTTAVRFDARYEEMFTGIITHIQPAATEIDGVAYFETTIALNEPPTWLRAGLNADIDIIINERSDVVRIPSQYLTTTESTTSITTLTDNVPTSTTVITGLRGTDGYVEVTNVPAGTVIVTP